ASEIQKIAISLGLHGNTYNTVPQAIAAARAEASANDFIFVGGSTFIVSDLLSMVEFFIQG
ncbi:MAG: bifunctional folylpolyglutamate synthase/dihydrofolate synthase, partial [Bacteroidaceae bacterium]|nr:bifunctional folylpolyglutamate synthase/dihydrofolate synthase [Bacteroidaceae bacterium]